MNIQARVKAYENTVLSLNPDGRTLLSQESALRESGFEVISVSIPLQARSEIEMGRDSRFSNHPPFEQALEADIVFSPQDDPQAIVKWLCFYQQKKAS